jgi:DNA-binding NarL/FixJ family response regulator
MTSEPIEVWVVEDNAFLRETVAELIDQEPDMRARAFGSCEEALAPVERGEIPGVVLMDLGLPGMNGVEGIARMRATSPVTQIVVLTVHEDDDNVFDALCAGASGYLLKPASAATVVSAVRTAVSGGAPMNAFIASKVLKLFAHYARPRADYGLTDREREILQLLVQEMSQKKIATRLGLSPHTVDTHLRNIYSKLHVHSRSGAVAKALQERLLPG